MTGVTGEFGVTYTEVGKSIGVQGQTGQFQNVSHTYLAPNPSKALDASPLSVPGINPYEDAAATPFDLPNFSSLGGIIIAIHFAMLIISIIICIGRTDVNLVFYLMGYYLWCIHGHRFKRKLEGTQYSEKYPHTAHIHVASKTTLRAINHYTVALCAAFAFDLMFLFLGWETFFCHPIVTGGVAPEQTKCIIEMTPLQYTTVHVQRAAFFWMMVNAVLKLLVIGLSFTYTAQQRNHAQSLGLKYTGLR